MNEPCELEPAEVKAGLVGLPAVFIAYRQTRLDTVKNLDSKESVKR